MEHPLGAQALLLISYLISSIVVAAYRWAKEYLMKGQGLCIRGRILRVERLRFERILVLSSLAGLLFQGLCAQLCPVEHRDLLHIALPSSSSSRGRFYTIECIHLVWVATSPRE